MIASQRRLKKLSVCSSAVKIFVVISSGKETIANLDRLLKRSCSARTRGLRRVRVSGNQLRSCSHYLQVVMVTNVTAVLRTERCHKGRVRGAVRVSGHTPVSPFALAAQRTHGRCESVVRRGDAFLFKLRETFYGRPNIKYILAK